MTTTANAASAVAAVTTKITIRSGRRILTKGRIAFCAVIEDRMIPFAACRYLRLNDPCTYTAAQTADAF